VQKGVAGDDVRVNDKSLSSFTVAFSISGSLCRSFRARKREEVENSKRNRCKALAKEKKKEE